MTMALFIKGMGNISPQKTWDENGLLSEVNSPIGNRFTAVEPDYSMFVDPKLIRRMSRVIKMGVASAMMALKQSSVSVPDSIITATGYGCLEDTGTFLTKMVENKEQALNPTPFIQSTHNTIGSQIALILQCQGYNQTYANGAFSFESVLLDTLLQAEEFPSQQTLIGGVDEITPVSHAIQARFDIFNKGRVNGEGSAFFLVSGQSGDKDIARIERVDTFYKPDRETLMASIKKFTDECGVAFDFVLTGEAGGSKGLLAEIVQTIFPKASSSDYKYLCGEYPVSTAFACWLAARMIEEQAMPSAIGESRSVALTNTSRHQHSNTFQNILVLNSYFGTHYSLIHIKAC
jgi:3-oxoacyl-[acyl-carrier-protein] synthase II